MKNAIVDIINVLSLIEREQFSASCEMSHVGIYYFDRLFYIAEQKISKDSDLGDCLYS
jgi:hypothetical protein